MTTEQQVPARWRDEFVLAMRLRDADGAAIGDALAEVEEFCRDTGQDAAEAFGTPEDYAQRIRSVPVTWGMPWRDGLQPSTLVQIAGTTLLLWSVSAEAGGLALRLGQLLGVGIMVVGAVLVIGVAGPRFRFLVTWLVVMAVLGATVTLGALLRQTVAVVPVALAVAAGATLLLGGALWETWRAWRVPTADVIASPWDASDTVRRRNRRLSIAFAWVLPAMTLFGVGSLTVLDLVLDAAA